MTREELVEKLGIYGGPFEEALEEILEALKQKVVNGSLLSTGSVQDPTQIAMNFVGRMIRGMYGEVENEMILMVKDYFESYVDIERRKLYEHIMKFEG